MNVNIIYYFCNAMLLMIILKLRLNMIAKYFWVTDIRK